MGFNPGSSGPSSIGGSTDAVISNPANNEVLAYDANVGKWRNVAAGGGSPTPDATTTSKGTVRLAGDLGGTADLPTVPGLAAKADAASLAPVASSGNYGDLAGKPTIPTNLDDLANVDTTGQTDGQVLTYSSAASGWVAGNASGGGATDASVSQKGVVQLAGDLSGTASAPSVAKLKNITLPSGTPAAGQVLMALSSSQLSWVTPAETTTISGSQYNENSRISSVYEVMRQPQKGVYVSRSGADYSFLYGLDGGLWLSHRLAGVTGSGADGPYTGTVYMLRDVSSVMPLTSVSYTAGTPSGSGWATSTSGSWTWMRTNTSGDAYTWTSPAGATALGIRIAKHGTGGGVAKVSIDGDWFAANVLPTAQNLVDNGYLLSTALTTNGGTLAPNQPCYSSYAASALGDIPQLLATGLTAGAHVIRVEHSGYYKPNTTTAGERRVNFMGFASGDGTQTLSATNQFAVAALGETASAWEVATSFAPSGQSSSFMGTYHGNESAVSTTLTVDGVTNNLADGAIVAATNEIRFESQTYLSHPATGRVASVQRVYRLNASGFFVQPKVTWEVTGNVTASYAMMPLNGPLHPKYPFSYAMTSAYSGGVATIPTTTPLDQDFAQGRSSAAWVWGAKYAAMIHVVNIADWTSNWQYTDRFTVVEGRALVGSNSTTTLTKVYISRDKNVGETVGNGTVHEYTARISFAYYPSGVPGSMLTL